MTYERAELAGIWDEARGELSAALEDFWFARSMLRRLGEEERRRFSEAGWAWGDTTYTGGSPVEVFDGQLPSVLRTLGWDLCGEFFYEYPEEPLAENGILSDLRRPDGRPIAEEDYAPDGAGFACEDVLVAEIRGDWAELARLRAGLSRVRPGLRFYRYRPDAERARELLPGGAVLIILGQEMGFWNEAVQGQLFEWLIREWEVRHGRRAPEAGAKD